MRVNVIVSVDGVPVTGLFFQRLVSLTITDREGSGRTRWQFCFLMMHRISQVHGAALLSA